MGYLSFALQQTLWGMEGFLAGLSSREILEPSYWARGTTYATMFNETDGPYALVNVRYSGQTGAARGNMVKIIVDDEDVAEFRMNDDAANFVGEDAEEVVFLIAKKTLKIQTKEYGVGYGGFTYATVMRFG